MNGLLAAGLVHLAAEAGGLDLTAGEQRWRRTAWLAVALLHAGYDLPDTATGWTCES